MVMRYSTSNNGVPLKSGLKVIENGTFGNSMLHVIIIIIIIIIMRNFFKVA